MPIVVAAWLTTAAYENARAIFRGGPVSKTLGIADHAEPYEKYRELMKTEEGASGRDFESVMLERQCDEADTFLRGDILFAPWATITEGKCVCHLKHNAYKKPLELIPGYSPSEDTFRAKMKVTYLLLGSMKLLLYGNHHIPKLTANPMPVLRELNAASDGDDDSIQTSMVFGIQLILGSYRSFIHAATTPNTTNCRLQTIQFAQEVLGSLLRVWAMRPMLSPEARGYALPCDCSDCEHDNLTKGLIRFEDDLGTIISQKKFGLYHQAPWVADSQMNHILSEANHLVIRLCNRG